LKINAQYLNDDTWRPSMGLVRSDRTLRLHPINLTGASGHPEVGTLLSLTALFFGDTYKYLMASSWGSLLTFFDHPDILLSWAYFLPLISLA
jgi:hypothetical protein